MAAWDESRHPRDRGKFSSSQGESRGEVLKASIGERSREHEKQHTRSLLKLSRARLQTLTERLLKDEGFTYQMVRGVFPTSGFVVSAHPEHELVIHGHEHVNGATFTRYLADPKRAALLRDDPRAHLGAWYDVKTDRVVLDVVHVEKDREKAIAVAKVHGQEAIYDLGKKEPVEVSSREEIDAARRKRAPPDS